MYRSPLVRMVLALCVAATVVGAWAVQGGAEPQLPATGLLSDRALEQVQAVTALPVAVDDEGGRVQRIDALDGELPSARSMTLVVYSVGI